MKEIINNTKNIYMIGIGGIGMSALAKYFRQKSKKVAGYDRTPSSITRDLECRGISIHYEDSVAEIPETFLDKNNTIVIYTPAIPPDHGELTYFLKNEFKVFKRSEILGAITEQYDSICVAGTHGKTTVTTMITWLLHKSSIPCISFMGGISKNFNDNFLFNENPQFVIAEADEFDRSFLKLHPNIAVITSVDSDHLDVYKNYTAIKESFLSFVKLLPENGKLIIKYDALHILNHTSHNFSIYTYSLDNKNSDYYAKNIKKVDDSYTFDIVTPNTIIKGLSLSHPGLLNVENAVAAIAVATQLGLSERDIKENLKEFKGSQRRFDVIFKNKNIIYIDDYAHHPKELETFISSVRDLYPGKKISGIFQPHLYSRTRDFADEFAESLSKLDQLILLDIYPAREEPIPGITSEIIFNKVKLKEKVLLSKNELMNYLNSIKTDILLTMGAGDISNFVKPIQQLLSAKYEKNN